MVKKNDDSRTSVLTEKEWYRKKIVNMVGNIQNEKHIKMIYGFVKRLYKE